MTESAPLGSRSLQRIAEIRATNRPFTDSFLWLAENRRLTDPRSAEEFLSAAECAAGLITRDEHNAHLEQHGLKGGRVSLRLAVVSILEQLEIEEDRPVLVVATVNGEIKHAEYAPDPKNGTKLDERLDELEAQYPGHYCLTGARLGNERTLMQEYDDQLYTATDEQLPVSADPYPIKAARRSTLTLG